MRFTLRRKLGNLLSYELVSKAFVGARLVKAFNHLPAGQLGTIHPWRGSGKLYLLLAMTPTPAQLLRRLQLDSASLQSSSEGSIRAAPRFMF
jgi:hypothetical protein